MTTARYRSPSLAIALAAGLATLSGAASALHPGETHSGDVPQGPESIACENQGWNGIEIAILMDGMVHCDDIVNVSGGNGDESNDGGDDGQTVE